MQLVKPEKILLFFWIVMFLLLPCYATAFLDNLWPFLISNEVEIVVAYVPDVYNIFRLFDTFK